MRGKGKRRWGGEEGRREEECRGSLWEEISRKLVGGKSVLNPEGLGGGPVEGGGDVRESCKKLSSLFSLSYASWVNEGGDGREGKKKGRENGR